MAVYAGIDWGGTAHAVCVLDELPCAFAHFEIKHDAAGLAELLVRLRQFVHAPSELRVAIERPSGLLVDTLLEAGFPVVPIHPNVVKACRPRYRAAAGKCDPGDAYLLADILRTDGHRFRPLAPECDEIRALRALVRSRDDLVAQRVALANQLRALLESFWPGAAAIFAEIDSPIALAFLERYPTPHSAARLGQKRLRSFLATHAYCGRRTAVALLARLRAAAQVSLGEARGARPRASSSRALVAHPRDPRRAARHLDRPHRARRRRSCPMGRSSCPSPAAGRINAAQILARTRLRARTLPHRSPARRRSRRLPRHPPVRQIPRRRLPLGLQPPPARALITWADNSRHASPWAAHLYHRARGRGARHPHAVRILARAWVRVLWRCWIDQQPYDPAKHHAAASLLATA